MSISCWMLSLFSVMSIPRLLMSCCILDIQVVRGRPRFLFDGFSASVSAFLAGTSGSSRIRWPIQEWRRLSIVLLHGSAFVSLYSLAFDITCGYTMCIKMCIKRWIVYCLCFVHFRFPTSTTSLHGIPLQNRSRCASASNNKSLLMARAYSLQTAVIMGLVCVNSLYSANKQTWTDWKWFL